nr:unnamed protein product [Callosobruchus chinensis]
MYKERQNPRESDFRTIFRFEEINVQCLADYFIGENLETRGGALSPVHKMNFFLRCMADPGFQSGIGEELGYTIDIHNLQSPGLSIPLSVFKIEGLQKICI